jgi:glycosyltransferase involved in cell wall biosynthesis
MTCASKSLVNVLLVSPYGAAGGGMGRSMEYLAEAAPAGFAFTFIESRGQGRAAWSAFFAARAALCVTIRSCNGRRNILHVNMAERGSVLRKSFFLYLGRILGVPTVLHLHAAEMAPFYDSLALLPRRLLRLTLQRADAVIVLGRAHAAWVRVVAGVAADRITIVPNGVAAPAPAATPASRGDLLFLGNLVARKGVTDLLCALAAPCLEELPWSLTMAGAGDAGALRRQAESLGIGARVEMQGWVTREASRHLLARAGALILPSYHEALPLSVLEALSYGVPVITTPVGSLPEVLRDGETALFVPPGDVTALTAAILALLTDEALAARLGQAGRALYQQEFTQARFAARICAVYQDITNT